jgi:hypothetical protein
VQIVYETHILILVIFHSDFTACYTFQVRGSAKLKRIMQTILSLGNALNHGTARGEHISITVRLPNTVFISKRDIGSIQEFEFASAFFFIYFFSFDRLSYRISPG